MYKEYFKFYNLSDKNAKNFLTDINYKISLGLINFSNDTIETVYVSLRFILKIDKHIIKEEKENIIYFKYL